MRHGIFSLLAILITACAQQSTDPVNPNGYVGQTQRAGGPIVSFYGTAGSIQGVPVAAQASLNYNGQQVPLTFTGAGLRVKSVFIASVDVYVAAMYAYNTRGGSTSAVLSSPAKSIRLTLVRDVSASQMQDAFVQAMQANGVDATQGYWASVIANLNTDYPQGTTATFTTVSANGTDTLYIDGPTTFTTQGQGIGIQFFRMWLGNPVDDGVATLQQALVSGRVVAP